MTHLFIVAACRPVVAKNAAKRVANARSSCEVVFMVAVPSAHGVDRFDRPR